MQRNYDNLNFYEYKESYVDCSHIKSNLIFGDFSVPTPSYTIFIPTYKRPHLLKECIEYSLNQKNFSDYEIIVLENDPEPESETEKLMQKYKKNKKIFYYKTSEWNPDFPKRGFELARTKWLTMVSDDDFLFPDYLYKFNKILVKYPDIEALSCDYKIVSYDFNSRKENVFKNSGLFKKLNRKFDLFWNQKFNLLAEANIIGQYFSDYYYINEGKNPPIGVMYKRENILKLGGWNYVIRESNDWVLNVSYLLQYNLYYMTEILAAKREGDGNESVKIDSRVNWIVIACLFLKTFAPHLKVLDYDEKYVRAMMAHQAENTGLKFEDFDLVVDGKKLFDKNDFTPEMVEYYLEKKKEYRKKLYSSTEPLEVYTKL